LKNKILLTVSVSILLLSLSILGALPVIRVNASLTYCVYPGQSIQEAINSAESGGIIYVYNGTYYEHVVVNKQISLIGKNRSTTVIDGNGTGSVINITSSYVNVYGFTIRNGTNGISIRDSFYNIISGNIVTDNQRGMYLFAYSCPCHAPRKNTIVNNTIKSNSIGIRLEIATENAIYHNNFINNTIQTYVTTGYANTWDDGYPSGGNYWSNHVCTGNPNDGSQPYTIDTDNIDHYPFQNPNSWRPSTIIGDVNGDGVVDICDIVIVAIAFGSKPGSPKWNPDADLNDDETVDIEDIVLAAINFGAKYS